MTMAGKAKREMTVIAGQNLPVDQSVFRQP